MYTYDAVFEGGGAKGVVFVGAIQEMEARNFKIRCFVGTSAGSITATLLAAGYQYQELLAAVSEKLPNGKNRFSSFMDEPRREDFTEADINESLVHALISKVDIPFVPDTVEQRMDRLIINGLMGNSLYRKLFSFVERGGLYVGNAFLNWITEKLNAGGRNLADCTFAQFYERTHNHLSVVASDITGSEMLVINHITAPECPVAWGVRMSMSIPFMWHEVRWQKAWGLYKNRDITDHAIVDGGVLSNFPIQLIADNEYREIMGDIGGINTGKIGLLIDETLPVPGAPPPATKETQGPRGPEELKNNKFTTRLQSLINTMTSAHDKTEIQDHEKFVCRLPAQGYETMEFDMSDERMAALINGGRQAAKAYFDSAVAVEPAPIA